MDPFEFFVEGRSAFAANTKTAQASGVEGLCADRGRKALAGSRTYEGALKLTVVYYHEGPAVSSDLDNMIKPIQDALEGLVYRNDRQITDAQMRKTNIDGRFRLRRISSVYARAFGSGKEFVYIRIEEAPNHEELL